MTSKRMFSRLITISWLFDLGRFMVLEGGGEHLYNGVLMGIMGEGLVGRPD